VKRKRAGRWGLGQKGWRRYLTAKNQVTPGVPRNVYEKEGSGEENMKAEQGAENKGLYRSKEGVERGVL